MTENLIDVKHVALKNNCPECYSKEGLRLTFRQKIKETNFYRSITSEVSYEINCNNCNSVIYPVQWTDDIERVFEYQKKAFTPNKSSAYLKKASWIVIGVGLGIIALIFALLFYYNL
jgi:hypothetical protein